jgi:hypothetical protein
MKRAAETGLPFIRVRDLLPDRWGRRRPVDQYNDWCNTQTRTLGPRSSCSLPDRRLTEGDQRSIKDPIGTGCWSTQPGRLPPT